MLGLRLCYHHLEILILKNILLFIYLFMRDTEREGGRDRQKEKQAPCEDPDVGLDPGTLEIIP